MHASSFRCSRELTAHGLAIHTSVPNHCMSRRENRLGNSGGNVNLRKLGVYGALVSLLACGSDNQGSSSGTPTFQNWQLGEHTTVIGGSNTVPDAELTEIRQVVPIHDDTVLVVDSRILSVLVFNDSGKVVRRIGRQGEGPGEFGFLSRLGNLGDSIWVSDGRKRLIHFFALDGAFRSSRPLQRKQVRIAENTLTSFSPEGILRGGKQVGFLPATFPFAVGVTPPPPHGRTGVLGLFDGDTIPTDTLIAIVQASGALTMNIPPYIHFPGDNHFADTPLYIVSSDGQSVVLVAREMATSTEMQHYRVTKWDAHGKQVFSVDVPYQPVAISETTIDSIVDLFADDMKTMYPTIDVAKQYVRDSLRSPKFYPPVSHIVVGTDGSTWLGRESLSPPPFVASRYDVLDAKGLPRGKVSLNRPGRILAATASSVWVVENDADDTPALYRYRIIGLSR